MDLLDRLACVSTMSRVLRLGHTDHLGGSSLMCWSWPILVGRWSARTTVIELWPFSRLMVLLGSLSHVDMCSATLMVTGQYQSLRSMVATSLYTSHSSCTVVVVPLATSQLHEVRLVCCPCRLASRVSVGGHVSPFDHAERLHMYNTHG